MARVGSSSAMDPDREPVSVRVRHTTDSDEPVEVDYSIYRLAGSALVTEATVTEEGRITINVDSRTADLPDVAPDFGVDLPEYAVDSRAPPQAVPPLSIVMQLVGSRGDVQPFLALAKKLQVKGHRVRIATHGTFRDFVGSAGVDFFDIGGDPKELMSYMVKNPGLMPGFESLRNGDISRKREMVAQILQGCFRSTHDPDTNPSGTEGNPFVADAIIMNPPSFAGVHVAEALGIPVHMMFTMPWCSTTAFPHPLVNIGTAEGVQPRLLNQLTYGLADHLTWQGLSETINNFRTKTLGLDPLSIRSGPGLVERLRVPWTYCWSPALIPKPPDWKSHIDIVGFWFWEGAQTFRPDPRLQAFLDAGEPPVYIGFGSVPVRDPDEMTRTIFEAVERAGKRALVSAGWGNLGASSIPSNVFIVGNVPHDWLFSRVAAVVHHGGAGTTAIGLRLGKPTVIVPFFGDQAFWGSMVHEAGAGPPSIPSRELTAEKLGDALKFALLPATSMAAERLGCIVRAENGEVKGVESFQRHLPLLNMRCELLSNRLAVWYCEKYCIRLSALAAQILVDAGELSYRQLAPHRPKEYLSKAPVTDPVTGGGSAILQLVVNYYAGIAKSFVNPVKNVPLAIVAIPKGVATMVGRTSQGFRNLPRLYGGQVREVEEPRNFGDGMKKGIQSLGYGYLDAITGLVDEPLRGSQSEGAAGFFKGAGRGILNASFKPAAGALGLVEHPARGLLNTFKGRKGGTLAEKIARIRRDQGREAASERRDRRSEVLSRWKTGKTKERVEARLAERVRRQKELGASVGVQIVERDDEADTDATPDVPVAPGPSQATASNAPPLPPRRAAAPAEARHNGDLADSDADRQFERDLELAMRLSLAERSGSAAG